MFKFIVRYLGFLKQVPFFATFVEAWMMMYHSIANPRIIHSIDLIEKEVTAWHGVYVSMHKFGGIQFNYNGKEIGHIHSNGILDILFSTKTKKHLLVDGRVADHHVFTKSGWISFYIRSEADVEKAIDLLKLSLTSNRIALVTAPK
jgi:hypothetical protein